MVSRWAAALFAVGQLATTCCAQTAAQVSDVPSVNVFMRRVFARATVLENYLYFDGGEVSQLVNGKNLTFRNSNPVNSTLSIDLSTSWKPSEVKIIETKKGSSPTMMRQAIFTRNSSNTFYIWGGFTSYGGNPPDAKLWRFTPDGSGSGSWATELPPGNDAFTKLERSQGGVFVSTPDSGFYFGGYSQKESDPSPNGPVPGYVQFNYTADLQAWTNSTDVPYSQYGTIAGGAAQYVPTFGPNGLIVMLGGGQYTIGSATSGDDIGFLALDTIYFMDPVTKKWYTQRTSGNTPAQRQWHCVVGAQGTNNTYEIFMFGGSNKDRSYDEVWVLSLPGFVWKKADYESSSPRDAMGCVRAGNRQMITVGGVNRQLGTPGFFRDKDPFPQGLGVFDLTDMKWTEGYDAGAASYDSPDVVKSWYEEGNLANVEYSTNEVAQLFRQTNSESGSGSGSDSGSGSSSSSSSSSGPNAGAIAGGVVGGVAGVALIGLGAFCLLRRRKRQQAPVGNDPATAEAAHYNAQYSPVPPSTTVAAFELAVDHRAGDYHTPPPDVSKTMHPPELDSNSRQYYELDGSAPGK